MDDVPDVQVSKQVLESDKLDIYGPNIEPLDLTFRTTDGDWRYDDKHPLNHVRVEGGFVVPGTRELFVVHPDPKKEGRWRLTHRPSGAFVAGNFPNRDYAEAVGCWIYCNAADRLGLGASDALTILQAMGARVKSAFKKGRPFLSFPRVKKQQVGTQPTTQEAGELYWRRRLKEIEELRREWRDQHIGKMQQLKNETANLNLQHNERKAKLDLRAAGLDAREKRLQKEEAEAQEYLARLQAWHVELADTAGNVMRVKKAVLDALSQIDPGEEFDPPVGRYLRKVRIPDKPPVIETEGHSENNSPSTSVRSSPDP